MTPDQFSQLVSQLETKLKVALAVGMAESAILVAEEAKSWIGHEHQEWPRLAPSTIERKGSAEQPLFATGEMQESIRSVSNATSFSVGSDNEKAVDHEHGTRHVPPRPFLSSAAIVKTPEVIDLLSAKIRGVLKA